MHAPPDRAARCARLLHAADHKVEQGITWDPELPKKVQLNTDRPPPTMATAPPKVALLFRNMESWRLMLEFMP